MSQPAPGAPPPESKQNWFSTLPGLVTAGGTFIAAVTGLLVTLNQVGILPVKTEPAKPTPAVAQAPTEHVNYVVWHMAMMGGSWRLNSVEYPGSDPCNSIDRRARPSGAEKAMLKTVRDYYGAWNDGRLDDAWALLSPSYQRQYETTWRATHTVDNGLRLSSDCVLSDSRVAVTVRSTPK